MPQTSNRRSVLFSVPPPSASSNPYTTLLAESVRDGGADVSYFSWRKALCEKYDVLHVHWPETMVRDRSRLRAGARLAAGIALLLRLRLRRTAVVQTVHNNTPHEPGNAGERLFLQALERMTVEQVFLNASSENSSDGVVILHGEYLSWYGRWQPTPQKIPNGVLFFGLIRPYKGIEQLLVAFGELTRPDAKLSILGAPTDSEYAEKLRNTAKSDSRVRLQLQRIDDPDLTVAVTNAAVVALPYKRMYNSGALMLSLSLGTHVLVPDCPVNRSLVDEFGEDRITLFSGNLDVLDIERALAAADLDADAIPMDSRQWDSIAVAHLELYDRVVTEIQHRAPIGPRRPLRKS